MKISIGGIKFSEELVHVTHRALSTNDRSYVDLIKRIAEKRINMPFVCSGGLGAAMHNTFCVAADDFLIVARLFDTPPILCERAGQQLSSRLSLVDQLQIIHGVGTLTLFPHRRSLTMLGQIIDILGQYGIIIHSLCTSISAIAINVDYQLLDQAVEALEKIVELPENHAPFRPEFSVRQISP
ncbi:MAG: hypothetical protein KJ630_10025 [Proteobacteria bacterium]|nr:hypothetical protein [Pseudomonadota bacterium]